MTWKISTEQLEGLIARCLEDFYQRRLAMLEKLKLGSVLRRKNPYLFRALGLEVAAEIIQEILHAYVSSSEEAIFGDAFFEPSRSGRRAAKFPTPGGLTSSLRGRVDTPQWH